MKSSEWSGVEEVSGCPGGVTKMGDGEKREERGGKRVIAYEARWVYCLAIKSQSDVSFTKKKKKSISYQSIYPRPPLSYAKLLFLLVRLIQPIPHNEHYPAPSSPLLFSFFSLPFLNLLKLYNKTIAARIRNVTIFLGDAGIVDDGGGVVGVNGCDEEFHFWRRG